jgi:hypothetical protein
MDARPCEERCVNIDMNERALVGFQLLLLVRCQNWEFLCICKSYALDIAWHVN